MSFRTGTQIDQEAAWASSWKAKLLQMLNREVRYRTAKVFSSKNEHS